VLFWCVWCAAGKVKWHFITLANTKPQLPADGAETAEHVATFVILFDILIYICVVCVCVCACATVGTNNKY
jgi:hypothetical protein